MSTSSTSLVVQNVQSRTDAEPELPLQLRRPTAVNPIAVLTCTNEPEGDDGGGPRWKITGSPAVIMLAKRIFSGLVSRRADSCSWPAVASMFEDLLMLQHRFPIEMAPPAYALWENQHRDLIRSHEVRSGLVHAGAAPSRRYFNGRLMPFQEEGARFLHAGRRALLADDMGLGKTLQAFAFLDDINVWPVAIVCQSHVVRHWERKIEEFMGAVPADRPLLNGGERLTWATLRGTQPSRRQAEADIYIVHYLIMHGWTQWLGKQNVQAVIFDEAQELRHPGTRKHDACRMLARKVAYVGGLSGTPIYNRGPEIYAVMNTINRGCLGTKESFHENWCSITPDGFVVADADLLGTYLRDRGLMLRRRKDEVLTELPPKRRVIEPIDADNATFAELVKEAVKLAKDAQSLKNPFDRARMEAEAINQTRRATAMAKLPAAIAFIRGLMEAEEPTLVFAHHHAVYDAILEALADYNPVAITGRESQAQKTASQDRFAAGETNLCLLSLRVATGIDGLQARARVVVNVELDWSPAVHRQAEDRAHRMGQKKSVLVYYLVTDVGSDPMVMETLNVKESQFNALMHEPAPDQAETALAEQAAKQHMAAVLAMLRGRA